MHGHGNLYVLFQVISFRTWILMYKCTVWSRQVHLQTVFPIFSANKIGLACLLVAAWLGFQHLSEASRRGDAILYLIFSTQQGEFFYRGTDLKWIRAHFFGWNDFDYIWLFSPFSVWDFFPLVWFRILVLLVSRSVVSFLTFLFLKFFHRRALFTFKCGLRRDFHFCSCSDF